MICSGCNKDVDDTRLSEYTLKATGDIVQFCFECENDELIYLDKIKRDCLIDGESYEVTKKDEKHIEKLRQYEHEREEEDRLMELDKPIFFFCNKQGKSIEINHQILRYCFLFLGIDEDTDEKEYVERVRFPYSISKSWKIHYEGLGEITITLDGVKKSVEKVRKDSSEAWRDRTRKWYFGEITVPECDLYNCTFGFATYSNRGNGNQIKYNDIYVNYDYICSMSWKFKCVIAALLKLDGFVDITDYEEKQNEEILSKFEVAS